MLLTESGLVLIALLLAFLIPEAGSSLFQPVERGLAWVARRRRLAVLTVGATALGLRAAVLPILPIPYPVFQDEFSYLLMSDTFAHGRLTNPTHPFWVHFENIGINQHPTYSSMYYPAQGMFLAFGQVVFRHPFWGVWISVGLMCAAICWMLQAWVSPFWALIAGLLAAVRIGAFSYWANSYWGGAVAAIGGALVLGALPRIKRKHRMRDAFLMGAGFAILANSRPYEGLFFSIPVLIALAVWVWRGSGETLRQRMLQIVFPLALVLTATAGFMLYYFWRTTQNPLLPPYVVNLRTYFVEPGFPWLPLRAIPEYHHEMLRHYYLGWNLDQFELARTHPIFPVIIKVMMLWFFFLGPLLTFPFLALGIALPYGMSLKDLRPNTGFLLIVCGATLAGLLLPAYTNPHYAAPLTAAVYALMAMAMRVIRRWRLGSKRTGVILVRSVPAAVVALLLLRIAIPIFQLRITNYWALMTWCSPWTQVYPRAEIESRLQALSRRQLVLVHYAPPYDASASWVNNLADIDGAKVIWAHDMGADQNEKLIRYFSDRQVWLLNPEEHEIQLTPYPVAGTGPTQPANENVK